MRLYMIRWYIFLCILLVFLSCKREKEILSLHYNTSPFEYVKVEDALEIYLLEDSTFSIEVRANRDGVDQIKVEVIDSVLHISDHRTNKWLKPKSNKVSVYITSCSLKEVVAAEGCKTQTLSPITSNEFGIVFNGRVNEADLELNCETFYYWNDHPCGGRLTLSGQTNRLKIWNFALVSVDAKNLLTNHALVINDSKGDCEVTVLNSLEYSITGVGNICLFGNPDEILADEVTSTGRLIQYE